MESELFIVQHMEPGLPRQTVINANAVAWLFTAAHQGLDTAHVKTAGISQFPGTIFLLEEMSFYLLIMLVDFLGSFRRKPQSLNIG